MAWKAKSSTPFVHGGQTYEIAVLADTSQLSEVRVGPAIAGARTYGAQAVAWTADGDRLFDVERWVRDRDDITPNEQIVLELAAERIKDNNWEKGAHY